MWTGGWCYVAIIIDLFLAEPSSVGARLPAPRLPPRSPRLCIRPSTRPWHAATLTLAAVLARSTADALGALGVEVSMSRIGNCWDNAVAESFFATLKAELVYRSSWTTRDELRVALFRYLEVFYNRRRLHSSIGYQTPAAFEMLYTRSSAA